MEIIEIWNFSLFATRYCWSDFQNELISQILIDLKN